MPTDNHEANLQPLQQHAIEWLLRLRTRELTEAETRAFADWLSQDAGHAQAFADAEDLFDAMSQAAQMEAEPVPVTLSGANTTAVVARLPKRRPGRWLAVPLALAATWLFAATLVMPKQISLWDAYFSDYHTGTGEQRSIRLADGSQMLLDTGTAVSVDYQDTSRHVTLHHGQAQFTVTGDAARPFTVSAGELQVRALGTVFDVYRKASGDIHVTVREHAVAARLVAATDALQTPTLRIGEGQQLHYVHDRRTLEPPEAIDSGLAGAWRQRLVIIKDRPLAELVAEIERYRPGRIFLGGENLNNLRVTGLFSLADPDASLAKVRAIMGLKETRLGPLWVLLHR